MNLQTRALVSALEAVNGQVPGVVRALLDGKLSAERQHTFATLLVDLGELLHEDADYRGSEQS
ncbi:hypothetical protein [Amycolatopsis anabasis]|uniref:hypothetical protein n=1 Tax=Amycolatopsis anabasis TaxID=1840409 RepID=UPI00131E43FC|nr:hypothetical protein [Amycolatopsis anabasis]